MNETPWNLNVDGNKHDCGIVKWQQGPKCKVFAGRSRQTFNLRLSTLLPDDCDGARVTMCPRHWMSDWGMFGWRMWKGLNFCPKSLVTHTILHMSSIVLVSRYTIRQILQPSLGEVQQGKSILLYWTLSIHPTSPNSIIYWGYTNGILRQLLRLGLWSHPHRTGSLM